MVCSLWKNGRLAFYHNIKRRKKNVFAFLALFTDNTEVRTYVLRKHDETLLHSTTTSMERIDNTVSNLELNIDLKVKSERI